MCQQNESSTLKTSTFAGFSSEFTNKCSSLPTSALASFGVIVNGIDIYKISWFFLIIRKLFEIETLWHLVSVSVWTLTSLLVSGSQSWWQKRRCHSSLGRVAGWFRNRHCLKLYEIVPITWVQLGFWAFLTQWNSLLKNRDILPCIFVADSFWAFLTFFRIHLGIFWYAFYRLSTTVLWYSEWYSNIEWKIEKIESTQQVVPCRKTQLILS